ncbi:hypothetical protein ACN47E_010001 [Coniothyrium glycines]
MALSRLQAIFACLACLQTPVDTYSNEKQALLAAGSSRSVVQVADDVVSGIIHTSVSGNALRMKLDSIVGTRGWTENLAKWILEKLTQALQDAHRELGPIVRDAFHKAWEVARSIKDFVIEHRIMSTIIALGVLCIVAPWVIEALGFAELGPVEGTFASAWQSTYGGLVPKGSMFSFFQRLGMTWRPILV